MSLIKLETSLTIIRLGQLSKANWSNSPWFILKYYSSTFFRGEGVEDFGYLQSKRYNSRLKLLL
jgi:hypothetical protein